MSAWRQVEDAIKRIGGGHATLVHHAEKPWHSATFAGSKHVLTLSFAGPDAMLTGAAILAEMPGNPFYLPSYTVTACTVAWSHSQANPARLDFQLELLLLDQERAAA